MCWTPLYTNKHKQHRYDCALLQTTGSKDKPNIVVMRKSQRTSQHGTQNVKIRQHKKLNTDPTNYPEMNSGARDR
jgi:hypothetical protein